MNHLMLARFLVAQAGKRMLPATAWSTLPWRAVGLALCLLSGSAGTWAQVQRAFINLGFEQPVYTPPGATGCFVQTDQGQVPGWHTNAPAASGTGTGSPSDCLPAAISGQLIEIWVAPFQAVPARSGRQFAELNAKTASRLSQTICLVAGEQVGYKLSHRGRSGTDVMSFNIDSSANQIMRGASNNLGTSGFVVPGSCGSGQVGSATCNAPVGNNTWTDFSGSFTWNGTAGAHNFGFEAISTSTGDATVGNFLDDIQIQLAPYIEMGVASASGNESLANSAIPKLVITGNLMTPLNVTLQLAGTGTATLGSDFTTPSGTATWTVTIPAGNYDGGAASQFATGINVINDSLPEPSETIVVNLVSNPAAYTLAGTQTCGAAPVTQFTYTITDDDPPAVQIKKNSAGGVGTFNFSVTGATPASSSVATLTAGTDALDATVHGLPIGNAATVTETPVAGYTTSVACVDINSSLTGNTGSITSTSNVVTIPAANVSALASYVCTFANVKTPTLSLQKALAGSGRITAADQFSLSGTGTGAPAAQATTGTGTAITSAPYSIIATPGTAYTMTEAMAEAMAAGSTSPLTSYGRTVACTNTGSTVVTGFTTLPINVTPVAGDAITCTVTNSPQIAGLQLAKAWGPTNVAGDTANIGATSGGSNNTAAFSTSGGTPANSGAPVTITPVSGTLHRGTVGTAASVTETAVLGYTTATSCVDSNGAANGNGTGAVTTANGTANLSAAQMRAGAAWVCSYTNTRVVTNLTITKVYLHADQ